MFGMHDLFKDKKVEIDEKLLKPKESVIHHEGQQYDHVLEDLEKIAVKAAYKNYYPGTQAWKIIWKSHPELQVEMLEWAVNHTFVFCVARQQRIALALCPKECGCKNKESTNVNVYIQDLPDM